MSLFLDLPYSNTFANALHRLLMSIRFPSIHLENRHRDKARKVSSQKKKINDQWMFFLCIKGYKLLSRLIQSITGYGGLFLNKKILLLNEHVYCSSFLLSLIDTYGKHQFPRKVVVWDILSSCLKNPEDKIIIITIV